MTNLEAIRANVSDAHGVVLTESHFVKALADQGLAPDANYNNTKAIDRATLRLYDQLIASASISEGSLGYNVNIEGLRQARAYIAERIGIKPTINRAAPW